MAFPPGFRMIAGDAGKRNAFIPPPDIPQSLWGPNEKTPKALAEKAIGFNCLNYGGSAEGSLTRHLLPNKAFIDSNCADGLRLELMFPSCWNGVSLDADDHKSHVAYPDLVMEGIFFFFYIIYIALSIASINTMMLMQPLRLWSAAHTLLIPLS
jgi:hypothetical protein